MRSLTPSGQEAASPPPAETTAHGAAICRGHPGGEQQSYIQTQDFQLQSQALHLYAPAPPTDPSVVGGGKQGKESNCSPRPPPRGLRAVAKP